MKRRVSTAASGADDPVDFWRSWLANEMHPVDVRDFDPEGFRAECELTDFGDLTIAEFRGTRQSFFRSQSQIRSSHSDNYVVSITETAPAVFSQQGLNTAPHDGDVILLDSGRPYAIVHDSDIRVLSVAIPRKLLEGAFGAPDAAIGVTLEGHSPAARIISSHFRSLADHAGDLEPALARRMALGAVDLIAAAFDERLARADPRRLRRSAAIIRAQAFIEDNLSEADLDLPRVAAFVGVSPRRLHEIFAGEGMSLIDLLWERRLLRAHKLLSRNAMRHLPVASVAYRVGFKSPAHFARRFKMRFGITPSELREQSRFDDAAR